MSATQNWRAGSFGNRVVRIANCSGYHGDPAIEMYNQASNGDVDFITGDYLAEVNMANNAEAFAHGKHPGYEETAWKGFELSIDVLAQKQIKVAINGGALSPEGLAVRVAGLVKSKGYDMKVAYVSGDDVLHQVGKTMPGSQEDSLPHLDSVNSNVTLTNESFSFTRKGAEPREIVSANAYLGAHAIYKAFVEGADIVICGRVSDASPVIACAWYWWSWHNSQYDELAGALIAGHLIECSAYVTGGNFAGFDAYDIDQFLQPGFPIAEVARDGSCVITKHPGTGGMVTVDTCRCQLLYELQGDVYLNSDVKAYIGDIAMEKVGEDRIHVSGVRGAPPPPTTKLAVFYKGGYEVQLLFNATGYATDRKFELFEKQLRRNLGEEKLQEFDTFEFQQIGTPGPDPRNQNSSTVYFRVFAQASNPDALMAIGTALRDISLRHFSGFHSSLDLRTALPRSYLAYYPALWPQEKIEESVHFVSESGTEKKSFTASQTSKFEDVAARDSYDTQSPVSLDGESRQVRLGDIVLGRSGDKGANLNVGLFVQTEAEWDWLRSYLSRARFEQMLGDDLREDYSVERVEFPHIRAVHFVVYGILGRGVSSSKRLDGFGKGFVDYFRDKIVQVPVTLLGKSKSKDGSSKM